MARPLPRRPLAVAGACILAFSIVLFPPWHARAIRTTTRYAAASGVEPSVVVDTIEWGLAFAPLYSQPRAPMRVERMRDLATRATHDDPAARDTLRRATADVERRVHVPEVLRSDGEIWRDSVLTAAGIPAVSSYDLSFAVDQRWLATRLVVLALLAFFIEVRASANLGRPRTRDRDH